MTQFFVGLVLATTGKISNERNYFTGDSTVANETHSDSEPREGVLDLPEKERKRKKFLF